MSARRCAVHSSSPNPDRPSSTDLSDDAVSSTEFSLCMLYRAFRPKEYAAHRHRSPGYRFARDLVLGSASRVSAPERLWPLRQPAGRGFADTPAIHHHRNVVALMPSLANGPIDADLRPQVAREHDLLLVGSARGDGHKDEGNYWQSKCHPVSLPPTDRRPVHSTRDTQSQSDGRRNEVSWQYVRSLAATQP